MACEADYIKRVTRSDVEIVLGDAFSKMWDDGTSVESSGRAELQKRGRGKVESKVASVAAGIDVYRSSIHYATQAPGCLVQNFINVVCIRDHVGTIQPGHGKLGKRKRT